MARRSPDDSDHVVGQSGTEVMLSVGGFLGAIAGVALGAINYAVTVPLIEQRLRALDKSETAAEREALETKISLMRRLILGIEVVFLGGLGYWLGKTYLGPALGLD